jgi:TolB protein
MKKTMNTLLCALTVGALTTVGCGDGNSAHSSDHSEHHAEGHGHGMEYDSTAVETRHYEQEKHLTNVRQLTYGGDNAEAYWSFDDQHLVFQSTNPKWGVSCDQIYVMNLNGMKPDSTPPAMASTGLGRTTCAYFMPGDSTILYASTHLADTLCPEVPERISGRYVWPIYASYDIFEADLKGNIVRQLTTGAGYDAEATLSPNGDKIVFTSTRSGDLELYTMNIDGSDVRQITDELGYDGGAFFSPDGTKLVWRASRPQTQEDQTKYKDLLSQGLVEPTDIELFIANVDGTDKRQITTLGNANWAPFFHPSGEKIIFSSNHLSERGFPFNLYMINVDGTGLEQITFDDTFDSFPMFSNNGKYLVFASNRNNGRTRDTNLFIAEWRD